MKSDIPKVAEADARSEVFQVGFRLDGAVGWSGWMERLDGLDGL